MVRTNTKFRAARLIVDDSKSQNEEEKPPGSDTTRDPLEELIADLEDQAGILSIWSARTGFPRVEDINLEDAKARELANKLAPGRKPRVRSRRHRIRSRNDERQPFPEKNDVREEPGTEHYLDRWAKPQLAKASREIRHNWIWGRSTGLLLVASIIFVFVFIGPLNGILLPRIGDSSSKPGIKRADHIDILAEIELVRKSVVSNAVPPRRDQSIETTPPRPAPKIRATPEIEAPFVEPSTVGSVVIVSHANSMATAGGEAPGSKENVVDPGLSGDDADKAANNLNAPRKTEDRLQEPALPRSAQAEPERLTSPPTTTPTATPTTGVEPVHSINVPAKVHLSAALIDSLLARGEGLLRSGNISAARLVFLRAAAAGDLRGARGVGMTYDPEVYARLPVTGLKSDREQAEFWYDKAGENSTFMTIGEKTVAKPDPEVAEAEERNAACARKYRSFNPKTGLYRSYRGVMRPCRLP